MAVLFFLLRRNPKKRFIGKRGPSRGVESERRPLMEKDKEEVDPLRFVLVVGFHHTLGNHIESSVPPLETYPKEWEALPFIALPDGCHKVRGFFSFLFLFLFFFCLSFSFPPRAMKITSFF
jgi:hypothetical protein